MPIWAKKEKGKRKMIVGQLKRCLAGVLAVATILSSSSISYAAESITKDDVNPVWETNYAEIISDHYGFTTAEKKLLKDEVIKKGNSLSVNSIPTEEGVEVDSAERVVTAKEFEGWEPISAKAVSGETTYAEAKFTGGKATFGEFEASGYEVKVTYDYDVEIDTDEQKRIIGIPGKLAEGAEYLDALSAIEAPFTMILNGLQSDLLNKELYSYSVDYNGSDPGTRLSYLQDYEAIKDAASKTLNDLNSISSYIQGEELKTEFNALYKEVQTLAGTCELATSVTDVFVDGSYPTDEAFEENVWALLEEDSLVSEGITGEKISSVVTAATTVVTKNVASANVTVSVEIQVAPEEALEAPKTENLKKLTDDSLKAKFPVDLTVEYDAEKIAKKIDMIKEQLLNGSVEQTGAYDIWASYGIDENLTYYTISESEVPTSLSEGDNYQYVITFVPRDVMVTNNYMDLQTVPYGSTIKLPVAGGDKVYDYVVTEAGASKYYNEGSTLKITAPVEIERSEATAKKVTTLLKLFAEDQNKVEGSEFTKNVYDAILASEAVYSPIVSVREPGKTMVSTIEYDTDNEFYYTYASPIESGMEGMTWIADSVTLMNKDVKVDAVVTQDQNDPTKFTWTFDGDYTHIEVQYLLKVTKYIETDGDGSYAELTKDIVKEYLNLPADVVADAKLQLEVLENAKRVYDAIESDNEVKAIMSTTALSMMKKYLSDDGKAAIDALLAGEENNAQLSFYTYLCDLEEAEGNKEEWTNLINYYTGEYYKKLGEKVPVMAESLAVLAKPSEKEYLKNAINAFSTKEVNIDSVQKQINEFVTKLNNLQTKIKVPYDAILVKSQKFATLMSDVQKLIKTGETIPTFANGIDVYAAATVTADAPGWGSYSVTVKGHTGNSATVVVPYQYADGEEDGTHVVTDDDVENINSAIKKAEVMVFLGEVPTGEDKLEAAYEKVAGLKKYYDSAEDAVIPTAGTIAGIETAAITSSYIAKTYSVPVGNSKIEFTGTQNGAVITLAPMENPEADCEYEYTVKEEGKEVQTFGGSGSYTVEDIGALADAAANGNSTITIERKVINRKTEEIDNLVQILNDALEKEGAASFIAVKNYNTEAQNGVYESVVLRTNLSKGVDFKSAVASVAGALQEIGLATPYIGFGQEDFLFRVANEIKVEPQTLVNVLMNSGLSSTELAAIINADGSVVDNVPVGENSKAEGEKLGGILASSSLQLGTSKDDATNIDLYITLGDSDKDYLKQLKSFLNTMSQNGLSFALSDGAVNFVGNLSENVWNTYIAFMLLMDNDLNLDTVVDADVQDHVKEIVKMMDGVLRNPNLTWDVICNTIAELGYDVSAANQHKAIIERLIDEIQELYGKYNEKEDDDAKFDNAEKDWFAFNVSYDAVAVLSKVPGFNSISDMLTDTVLEVGFKFQLVNLKDDCEAIVIDMGQSGIGKIQYTDDLAATLSEAKGFTYAVLLKEITDKNTENNQIVTTQTTILNLNGNVVHVPIHANGSLKIVDSKCSTESQGAVMNTITGNVSLTAGSYLAKEADEHSNSSYELIDNGDGTKTVHNKYYTLKEDAEGNLTVVLTTKFAEALHENVKDVAVEIATDLLFRAYTNSSVEVVNGGETYGIYDFDFADLTEYISNMSAAKEDVLDGINEEGITEFVNALIGKFTDFDAIARALTGDLTIASYDLKTSKWYATNDIVDGKITLSVNSGVDINKKTKSVTLQFAETDEELAASFKELDKIVTITPSFVFESIDYTSANGFQINGSAGANIVLNLLGEKGAASDYVTTVAVLLAYNMADGTAKNEFLKAIEYYDGNVYGGYLKEAFDTFTVGDLKAAIEKAKEAESFDAIIKALKLEGTSVGNHAAALEDCYKPLLDAFDEVYAEIENVAGKDKIEDLLKPQYDKKFADIKNADGYYDMAFKNASGKVNVSITMKLFATAAEGEDYVDNTQDFLDAFNSIPKYTSGSIASMKERASESADAIKAALEAYAKLTDEQKKIVAKEYAELQKLIESYEAKLGVWAEEITGTFIYKGSAHKPNVKVYFGAMLLENGKDYSVAYKYTTDAAKATAKKAPQAIITLKGNYSGKIHKYFTIDKINLSGGAEYLEKVGLKISEVNQAKSKKAKYSNPTIKLNGKKVDASNFKFTYPTGKAYKKLGTYSITITGNGKNFTGSTTVDLNVVTALLKNVTVEKQIKTQKYKEGGVKPGSSKFVLSYKGTKLVEGTHFEIVGYSNYDKAGTASVTLRGLGVDHRDENGLCFAGTLKLNYKIKAVGSLKKVTLKTTKKTYTGSEITLNDYKVKGSNGKTLVEGKDYKVTYKNNVKAGKATITFTGIGGYTGSVKKTFTIKQKTLSSKYLTEGKGLVVKYTKGGATPTSSIELSYKGKVLKNGTDYTIKWGNNTKARKATSKKAPYFKITGKGNFKGSFTVKFTITGTTLANTNITVKDLAYKNKKYNYKPSITVKDTNGKKLKSGTDYKVSYQVLKNGKWVSVSKSDLYTSKRLKLNTKNPEEFLRVKITGKGNYEGATVYKEYRMYYRSITKAKINVGDYTYSRYTSELRQTIEDNLKVYYGKKLLKVGTDYDYEIVSIKNYENAGEATVKVTGVNMYGGTLSKTFTIKTVNQAPTKITKSMLAAESKKLVVDYKKDASAKPSTKDIKLSYVDSNGETVNLVYGRDYTIKWYNTKKVAKSTAKKAPKFKITGKDNFNGSITVKYTIQKSDVADLKVSAKNKTYKNAEYNYKTKVTVKDVNGKALVSGKDYKVYYQVKEDGKWVSVSKCDLYKKSGKKIVLNKKTKSLEMRVVVKGKGSYAGKITDTYTLKR